MGIREWREEDLDQLRALLRELDEALGEDQDIDEGRLAELLEYGIRVAKARGMDELEVGVMKDNEAAIRFYKKHDISQEYLLLGMEFEA